MVVAAQNQLPRSAKKGSWPDSGINISACQDMSICQVNASIAWEFDKPGSTKFTDMARKIAAPYADVEQTKDDLLKFSREIAQAVVYGPGGLQERQASAGVTGDWIVYAPHKGQNYYLCISKHDEDEFILKALKQCGFQYPFVSASLNASGTT